MPHLRASKAYTLPQITHMVSFINRASIWIPPKICQRPWKRVWEMTIPSRMARRALSSKDDGPATSSRTGWWISTFTLAKNFFILPPLFSLSKHSRWRMEWAISKGHRRIDKTWPLDMKASWDISQRKKDWSMSSGTLNKRGLVSWRALSSTFMISKRQEWWQTTEQQPILTKEKNLTQMKELSHLEEAQYQHLALKSSTWRNIEYHHKAKANSINSCLTSHQHKW